MNGKILLMDDDDKLRDIIKEYLEKVGYGVLTAVDGVEALELYKEARKLGEPFAALILDLENENGMGGEATIQKLREIDPEVKAIVWSGKSAHPILADPTSYGFLGALAKPVSLDDLRELLHRVITGGDDE